MLLACSPCDNTSYAVLSDVFDTLRLLTDSLDFLDADADSSGWIVLLILCDRVGRGNGQIEANSALLLWMLKLLTYELKTYYIRSWIANLLISALFPYPGIEPASNLLLKLGDPDVIDIARHATDGYTTLHIRLGYGNCPEFVSRVLAKGPNLHLLGFDKYFTPEKESPTSLAMYSSWAFAYWLHGLLGIEVDLSTFIDQELDRNAFVHPGWGKETLHDLFDYFARHDLSFRSHWDDLWGCSDCGKALNRVQVQPYWRHLLERIKQRIDPDDPFRSDSGVDETQVSNIRSGMEASNDSDHKPDVSGSISHDEVHDDVGSEAEFDLEVELGSDLHGYPENVPIRSDCVYGPEELVCIDCWLHYRQTGTRFEFEDSSIDEYPSSEDESSDDEFSPYLIHA